MTEQANEKGVDIGFADKSEPWRLESPFFPSKIGGKPAWLDLEELPREAELQCSVCKQQMIFLCQVYAPFEEDENNFHRTLFVFVCRNLECCRGNPSNNIKVFRNQLHRQNDFYSEQPPEDKPNTSFRLSRWVKVCKLCGCFANKQCGKCKEANYCSREHQVIDWKENHKQYCGSGTTTTQNRWEKLFPEYELIVQPEITCTPNKVTIENELQEFARLEQEGQTGTMADTSESELESHCAIVKDKTFLQFRKRISDDPDQVLRYERGGVPLWIASAPNPDSIPDCEYCLSPRQFEFQIMPQMLTILEDDELDWGVLVVYTCSNSCVNGNRYKKEFVFKQNVSLD